MNYYKVSCQSDNALLYAYIFDDMVIFHVDNGLAIRGCKISDTYLSPANMQLPVLLAQYMLSQYEF